MISVLMFSRIEKQSCESQKFFKNQGSPDHAKFTRWVGRTKVMNDLTHPIIGF